MKNKWIISDTHFGHKNIIKFTKPDGSPIRPGFTREPTRAFTSFKDIEHHDETLIDRYNERVAPNDDVYFLGDFGHPLSIAGRLHGKKRLILGNHDDIHKIGELAQYFESVRAWRIFGEKDGFAHQIVLTHFPLHADERKPAVRRICVHGHIHEKVILRPNGLPDPWYINVCVEHTNHAPMAWEDLQKIVKKRAAQLHSEGYINVLRD